MCCLSSLSRQRSKSCLSAAKPANEKGRGSGPRSGRRCPGLPGGEVRLTAGTGSNLLKLSGLSKHLQIIHAWSRSTFRQEKVKRTPKGTPSQIRTTEWHAARSRWPRQRLRQTETHPAPCRLASPRLRRLLFERDTSQDKESHRDFSEKTRRPACLIFGWFYGSKELQLLGNAWAQFWD